VSDPMRARCSFMYHRWKRFVIGSLCLVTLVLAAGPPLRSSAATRTPRLPLPVTCAPKAPEDTGISYASDFVDDEVADFYYGTWFGLFNYWASSPKNPSATSFSPGIGAWVCQDGDILLFLYGGYQYNVTISAPGWSMIIYTPLGITVPYDDGVGAIDLGVLPPLPPNNMSSGPRPTVWTRTIR
jgi:hypothetical protein